MLRSLYSGVSGLRSHQTMLDTVGNNIANVNTTGFKSSSTVFEDTLSQMVKAAGAPQNGNGGTNPAQVGLGVQVASIATNLSQGALQSTGRATDLAIQGDGYFAVQKGTEQVYTRAGSFSADANGNLVAPDGAQLLGWQAVNGVVNTNGATVPLKVDASTTQPPVKTGTITMAGNLSTDATATAVTRQVTAYNAAGTAVVLNATFTPTVSTATPPAATTWKVTVDVPGGSTPAPTGDSITFSGTPPKAANVTGVSAGGLTGLTLDLAGITNYGGATSADVALQDGSPAGTLSSFTLSPDGTLVGVFSNGLKQPLGQVALASFTNPAGLEKVGDTDYRSTVNSGNARLGTPASGGRGTLSSGVLEMSNVDLSQEFTQLIIAQRGFEANSKVITTSDEVLNDLVNLKR